MGAEIDVAVRYEINRDGHEVRFQMGPFDHSRKLVIDPVLEYGTYFGGDRIGWSECSSCGQQWKCLHHRIYRIREPAAIANPLRSSLAGRTGEMAFIAKIPTHPRYGSCLYDFTWAGRGDDQGARY